VATSTHRRKPKSTPRKPGLFRRIGGDGPRWRRVLRWLALLLVLGLLGGALLFFVLYRLISIPDANADFQTQTTKVYYSDGRTELGTFAKQDRESIPLDEIPASMQAAVIAAEDRTFYENQGIDFRGILRAARDNATSGEITGGGSTITQQYVKVLYLNQERSYQRKVREAILSIKIHNQLSKQEILEGYLNTIYFGNGAYGVEVASQTYFDRPASKLKYPQAALLATVLNNPTYYDPYAEGAEERILPRFRYVLDGMVKSGAITQAQADAWQDKLPKVAKKKINNRFKGTNGYLLALVQKQLQDAGFSENEIYGGGLRVTTTFGRGMQRDAVNAVRTTIPEGLDELNVGLVAVEPGTGAVKAMYGGRDYLESQLNWAMQSVQPGSTFKVFALIAGLEDGYSLQTQLNGNSPIQIGGGIVGNQGDSGGQSFGRVTLDFATEKSVNTAFVDLTQQMSGGPNTDISVGAKKVLKAANQAGIPTSVTRGIDPVSVTSLGYAGVPAVDMANAYATIAADGERAEWHVLKKVTGASGNELPLPERETERTIPEDVAADTLAALQGVTQRGTGVNGRTICPTAGKTGTATAGPDDDQRVSSSWFVGATPKLATAVTLSRGRGNEDLEGYLNPFFGGTYPAQTFRAFMNPALEGTECGTFPPPANIRATKGQSYVAPTPAPTPSESPSPEPSRTPRPTPTPSQTSEPEPEPTQPSEPVVPTGPPEDQ
jgi:membrane peptidoglycan carboxypeptidase